MPIDPEVKKQLDAVVGEAYTPPRRWKATLAKWAVAAILAVAASAAIIFILHTHVMQAQTAPPAKRTVPVQIIPSK